MSTFSLFSVNPAKIIQAVRRRRGCDAHGGQRCVEWGRGFALFEGFAVLDGEGTAKDIKL